MDLSKQDIREFIRFSTRDYDADLVPRAYSETRWSESDATVPALQKIATNHSIANWTVGPLSCTKCH